MDNFLSKVSLKNFQSHKETSLLFNKGVNTILGDTDSGKSAIMRSLKWLITNRPSNTEILRHNTNKTEIVAEKHGHKIKRCRTKTENVYMVDTEKYSAIKTDVPENVQTALNLSEINIQEQEDIYFLLRESPGKRSKELNKISDLNIIDLVLKQTNNKIKKNKSKSEYLKAERKNLLKKIQENNWIDSADTCFSRIEELTDKLEKKKKTIINLKTIVSDITSCFEKKEKLLPPDFSKQVTSMLLKIEKIKKLKLKNKNLQDIVSNITSLLERKQKINIIDISHILNKVEEIEKKQKQKIFLENTVKCIVVAEKDLSVLLNKKETLSKELNNALKKIGVCPLCKRKM